MLHQPMAGKRGDDGHKPKTRAQLRVLSALKPLENPSGTSNEARNQRKKALFDYPSMDGVKNGYDIDNVAKTPKATPTPSLDIRNRRGPYDPEVKKPKVSERRTAGTTRAGGRWNRPKVASPTDGSGPCVDEKATKRAKTTRVVAHDGKSKDDIALPEEFVVTFGLDMWDTSDDDSEGDPALCNEI